MNYIKISKNDIANGPGVRVVLWLSGCSHACKGCHNPETWDAKAGLPFDNFTKSELFNALLPKWISGITFSGGDPLNKNNIRDLLPLIEETRMRFPCKNLWMYTGYTYEAIMNSDDEDMKIRQKIINNLDVLVDGPFILEQRDITLLWRGSPNQRVIDIQETAKNGKIKLFV